MKSIRSKWGVGNGLRYAKKHGGVRRGTAYLTYWMEGLHNTKIMVQDIWTTPVILACKKVLYNVIQKYNTFIQWYNYFNNHKYGLFKYNFSINVVKIK